MTIKNLLDRLASNGIHLRIESGKLKADVPKGAMTPELKQALVNHKTELIRLLIDERPTENESGSSGKSLAQINPDPAPAQSSLWDFITEQILKAINRSLANTGHFQIHLAFLKARWRWGLVIAGTGGDSHIDGENAAEKLNSFRIAECIQEEVRLALGREAGQAKRIEDFRRWRFDLEVYTYPKSSRIIEAHAVGELEMPV